MIGHKQKQKTRIKIGLSKKFEKNYNWKGDKVGYSALHKWVYKKLGKAILCSWCFSSKNVEWANISENYKRDINDWIQLCRRCHMIKDKRLENLKKYCYTLGHH